MAVGAQEYAISLTTDAIGIGYDNTDAIVAAHDALESTDGNNTPYYEYTGDFAAENAFTDGTTNYTFVTANDGTVAAKLCTEYTVESGGTSYDG